MKKVLAFVSGMSPAIITETIYALAKSEEAWVADDIYIFTTQTGKKEIEEQLLTSGVYQEMCNALKIDSKKHKLTAKNIEIITFNGDSLDDIRSKQDNDYLANFLIDRMFNLCKKDNTQVYVSLAGGRKTMSYYMGYALSLFGRPQDKLFHVLVSEPFDGRVEPRFYYPDAKQYKYKSDNCEKVLCGYDAKLELADIPFVSMRDAYPQDLIKKGDFRTMIGSINQELEFNNIHLEFDFSAKNIICNKKIAIKLTDSQMAIYLYFANHLRNGKKTIKLTDIDPQDILDNIAYINNNNTNVTAYEVFQKNHIRETDRILKSLQRKDREKFVKKFIYPNLAEIKQKIESQHFISSNNFKIQLSGKKGDGSYRLNLNPDNIIIP